MTSLPPLTRVETGRSECTEPRRFPAARQPDDDADHGQPSQLDRRRLMIAIASHSTTGENDPSAWFTRRKQVEALGVCARTNSAVR